ncbi:leucine-rich repeat-containing protein [Calothrix parasitica NIES-267]|uniref:Leucine-rich repeat-containing protein n=1 Tax=Calothrix parasitica NIES-267 TaxID=1973488 RepID=A0A1Z4LS58_9CYAN|nr:leucine-rich repeat-containing protein [Calothrix parasitica NIES-267]
MKKAILFLCSILALSHAKAIANQPLQQNKVKTFTEYCQQKSTLPQVTKDTVEILLKKAGTQDCQQANRKLSNLTRLYLWDSDKQISDLKPLSGFTNLTYLSLWGNQISDLKPLSSLTNLTYLNLARNQISDLKPLSNLTNLTYLNLWKNQVSDVKPLSDLTNLTNLDIDRNQISDIKPISSLTNLTTLKLRGNQISDIKLLSSLSKLEELKIQGNPLQSKTCPLKQESVCRF